MTVSRVEVADGCPVCDAEYSVEVTTHDDGVRVVRCRSCGWHDLTATEGRHCGE